MAAMDLKSIARARPGEQGRGSPPSGHLGSTPWFTVAAVAYSAEEGSGWPHSGW